MLPWCGSTGALPAPAGLYPQAPIPRSAIANSCLPYGRLTQTTPLRQRGPTRNFRLNGIEPPGIVDGSMVTTERTIEAARSWGDRCLPFGLGFCGAVSLSTPESPRDLVHGLMGTEQFDLIPVQDLLLPAKLAVPIGG
jgi:hypothetical protein